MKKLFFTFLILPILMTVACHNRKTEIYSSQGLIEITLKGRKKDTGTLSSGPISLAYQDQLDLAWTIKAPSDTTCGLYLNGMGTSIANTRTQSAITTPPLVENGYYSLECSNENEEASVELTFIVAAANPTFSILGSATLDFGQVQIGSSADLSFTVKNTSTQIISLSLSAMSAPFSAQSTACLQNLAINAQCNVGIRFQPSALPRVTRNLIVSLNGGAQNSTISLAGEGVAAPTVSLLSDLDGLYLFGRVKVGDTIEKRVHVTNNGTMTVTLGLNGINGPFSVNPSACFVNLAPGQTCQFGIVFAPTVEAISTKNGTITVSGRPETFNISVAGEGYKDPADTAYSVSSGGTHDFGQVRVGQSASHSFTITNNGRYAMSGLVLNDLNAPFSAPSFNCGGVINPGATCSFTVTFAPTAGGSFSDEGHLDLSTTHRADLNVSGSGKSSDLDTSFGTNGVFQNSSLTHTGLIRVLWDGHVLIAQMDGSYLRMIKLSPSGELFPFFGTNGILIEARPSSQLVELIPLSDGSFYLVYIVAGSTKVLKYNLDGTLNNNYYLSFLGFVATAADADYGSGALVLAGGNHIKKILPNMNYDPNFWGVGYRTLSPNFTNLQIQKMFIGTDSSVTVVGPNNGSISVVRVGASGAYDNTFNGSASRTFAGTGVVSFENVNNHPYLVLRDATGGSVTHMDALGAIVFTGAFTGNILDAFSRMDGKTALLGSGNLTYAGNSGRMLIVNSTGGFVQKIGDSDLGAGASTIGGAQANKFVVGGSDGPGIALRRYLP